MKHLTVDYVFNGSQCDDTYTCSSVSSTVSRRQGQGVVNLTFVGGSDRKGPVLWATYAPDIRVVCRPTNESEESQ